MSCYLDMGSGQVHYNGKIIPSRGQPKEQWLGNPDYWQPGELDAEDDNEDADSESKLDS